jgi:RNA polymerase sigma-70 factor (ECF subfamily)
MAMTHETTLEEPSLTALPHAGSEATALPPSAERLFAEHADYVWNALRRLGTARSDLEDLTHDTFVAALESWHRYDPGRPLRPWLFVLALRTAIDHRRLARHRSEVPSEVEHPDQSPSAVDLLVSKERVALAHEALQQLELTRRSVFILHELDSVTVPEIAAALDVPVATAYSRLRLAREDFAAAVRRLSLRSR